jgi:hypothetical protein
VSVVDYHAHPPITSARGEGGGDGMEPHRPPSLLLALRKFASRARLVGRSDAWDWVLVGAQGRDGGDQGGEAAAAEGAGGPAR